MHFPLLLTTFVAIASANVIRYHLHPQNDADVNDCVQRAVETMMTDTCLFFQHVANEESQERPADSIAFVQSEHCAVQESNRTVHLNSECINDEVCFELVGRALSVNQPRQHIARHINVHYNCTEKCTIHCLHGGVVESDCSCSCAYGFSGDRCESLSRTTFSDSSCGIVNAEQKGVVSLSSFPSPREKTTFCQWLIQAPDEWSVIDAEIAVLGLDDEDITPGTHCNDVFLVYGSSDVTTPIACDGTANVTTIHSNSNWLLFELRTNPYASVETFTGPQIKYNTRKVAPGVRIFSEGMTSTSVALNSLLLCYVVTLIIRL